MNSLVILLLLCPLVFSAAISIGSMNDYNGENEDQHPIECFKKASDAGDRFQPENPRPWTDDQLKPKKEVLEKCISEMALINPKVQKVEKQLVQKMFDLIKFWSTEVITCGLKLKSQLEDNECFRSTRSHPKDQFCDNAWGKDGCMIKKYDDICGEGMANKIRDMALFQSSKQKECIDKYFK